MGKLYQKKNSSTPIQQPSQAVFQSSQPFSGVMHRFLYIKKEFLSHSVFRYSGSCSCVIRWSVHSYAMHITLGSFLDN